MTTPIRMDTGLIFMADSDAYQQGFLGRLSDECVLF